MFIWVLQVTLEFGGGVTKFPDQFVCYTSVELIELVSNGLLVSNNIAIFIKVYLFVVFGRFVVDNFVDAFPDFLGVVDIAIEIPVEVFPFIA